MASSSFLRSTVALVALALSSLACTGGSDAATSSEVVVLRFEDRPYVTPLPPPYFADFERLAAFAKGTRLPRFPLPLVAVPVEHTELVAGSGPGRSNVTPGRTACERQAVPSRSRRKLRTWERELA